MAVSTVSIGGVAICSSWRVRPGILGALCAGGFVGPLQAIKKLLYWESHIVFIYFRESWQEYTPWYDQVHSRLEKIDE
jgi:hypothetical protein